VRRAAPLLALVVALALAACGETQEVREPDLVVRGAEAVATTAPETPSRPRRGVRIAGARIAIVTHGQASDPFWKIVRRGIDEAALQAQVATSYQAPDTYDLSRMRRMIGEAIDRRPDGLVVSLPDARVLAPAIRRAVGEGIPVITINSGAEHSKRLGAIAHVGQPEYRAGYESGRRMGAAGVRRAVCVNQEVGNAGLDVRCRAFAAGLRRTGGRSTVIAIRLQDPGDAQRRIARVLSAGDVDGVLTLGPAGAAPALAALRAAPSLARVRLATFDLSPEVLVAVRRGQMLFAVDQQPYLQGYLPVVLLAERARHGLSPAPGEMIATGPEFVTRATAGRTLQLSRQGIR